MRIFRQKINHIVFWSSCRSQVDCPILLVERMVKIFDRSTVFNGIHSISNQHSLKLVDAIQIYLKRQRSYYNTCSIIIWTSFKNESNVLYFEKRIVWVLIEPISVLGRMNDDVTSGWGWRRYAVTEGGCREVSQNRNQVTIWIKEYISKVV